MAKYRVGDEVTVRGIVTGQSPHVGPIVEFRRDNEFNSTISFAVPVEYIATHTPKPREFKAGDEVRNVRMPDVKYFIIATYGAWAWVRDGAGWTAQIRFSELRCAGETD